MSRLNESNTGTQWRDAHRTCSVKRLSEEKFVLNGATLDPVYHETLSTNIKKLKNVQFC